MVKRLIGLSAVLSLSLLATAASAAGPRPARLDKADQVARPVPAAIGHFQRTTHRTTTHAVRTEPRAQHARPSKVQRVQIRTDVVVGSSTRSTVSRPMTMSTASRTAVQNPVSSRMAQRARCEDSAACGARSHSSGTRMLSPNTQRDGVSEMRRKLRNERLYRMIMGKIMMKMHPGK